MKVRPILFSSAMVQALLDGRKRQTRRVVKPQPYKLAGSWPTIPAYADDWVWPHPRSSQISTISCRPNGPEGWTGHCPYGQPGDLLGVRESAEADNNASDAVTLAKYTADGAPVLYPGPTEDEQGEPDYGGSHAHWWYKRDSCPSIHMPRWASRLTLEITGVRVERLQDISDADAKAEGCLPGDPDNFDSPVSSRDDFHRLWESINGPGSWGANPWVWVLAFKVHRCNVDDLLKARAA